MPRTSCSGRRTSSPSPSGVCGSSGRGLWLWCAHGWFCVLVWYCSTISPGLIVLDGVLTDGRVRVVEMVGHDVGGRLVALWSVRGCGLASRDWVSWGECMRGLRDHRGSVRALVMAWYCSRYRGIGCGERRCKRDGDRCRHVFVSNIILDDKTGWSTGSRVVTFCGLVVNNGTGSSPAVV